jgi:hypothetical protein
MPKLIVFSGSRTTKLPDKKLWDDRIFVRVLQIVTQYDRADVKFASGGASSGADRALKDVCQLLGYEYDGETYKPDFSKGYHPGKFFARNKQLAKDGDIAHVIWNGGSKGTSHFIDCFTKEMKQDRTKELHIHRFAELEDSPVQWVQILEIDPDFYDNISKNLSKYKVVPMKYKMRVGYGLNDTSISGISVYEIKDQEVLIKETRNLEKNIRELMKNG